MGLFPNHVVETCEFGGKPFSLDTGKVAKQAGGAVLVQHADTVVLVTATTTGKPRRGMDFFPLVCDFVEKTYAAGKLPGGFFKREGRLPEHGILTSRLIDRPLRPLFPDGFRNEVQIVATVLSFDGVGDSELCALIGASAALSISDIPWNGPIAAARVGRVDGEFVACPSLEQLESSDMDLLIASRPDGIVMVEGSLKEVSEADAVEALKFGYDAMKPVFEAIGRLVEKVGKDKTPWEPAPRDEEFLAKVGELALPLVKEAAFVAPKEERRLGLKAVSTKLIEDLELDDEDERRDLVKDVVRDTFDSVARRAVLDEQRRVDGRKLDEIRDIDCQVGLLPRTHGSALFTRGETQALVSVTFGTKKDEQRIDALEGDSFRRFLLHYNFPPFSVGEVRMLRGPSRRDIGHGNLARRGVIPLIPEPEEFPYTIRIVSEILESNGSSSMATVCGSSLALMQAGVPIPKAVAGIAMGLISEGENVAVLSDILGDEDHFGDMDFKVIGTEDGITALQMDIKIESLSWDVLASALEQARAGRNHILGRMGETISEPMDDLSMYAPRIFTVLIDPDRIRDLIGPGGKHIRGIVAETGVEIDVDDEGRVNVAAVDGESATQAIELIRAYTEDPEVGQIYLGKVSRTMEFGAFVTIKPGTDGLCHISELAEGRVRRTEDVVREGDEIKVKVIGIDRQGKIKLSRRLALSEEEE